MNLTYGSLFTGIGGFDLGFDRVGLQGMWQVERDKDCNRVLDKHWPGIQRGTDVREVVTSRFGAVGAFVVGAVSSKWAKGSGGPAGDECQNLVTHSLSAEGADVGMTVAFSSKDHGADAQSELCPTLRSMNFDKSHLNGGGQVAVAFTERSRTEGRTLESQEEVAYALINPGSGGRTHSRQISQGMSVRRLTPRECERLQGFPDDWTRWDASGKEISDSARYRMLGNAVTATVAEWLGSQIVRNNS